MIGLIEPLSGLTESVNLRLPTAAALFTRLSLLVLLLPGIGDAAMPMRIRIALAVSLMLALLPVTPTLTQPVSVPIIISEALVGFSLGFSVRVFVFALNVTGAVIAQALSLSQVFGFANEGDSSSLVSSALTLTAATLFLTADLEVAVFRQLVEGLEAIPLGSATLVDVGAMASLMTLLGAQALELAVVLGTPFMVLNFAFYLILGLLNRAMPQLMVTFVGLPAITLGGLILFILGISTLFIVWMTKLTGSLAG
ncbi:MAG: flagellar biosynthetic protein FliR [Pseudomonadota bacterium]